MRCKFLLTTVFLWSIAVAALLGTSISKAQGADLKFQVQLVWATDDSQPPAGKDYKLVELTIKNQLRALKWKNYFEVKRIDFSMAPGTVKTVAISDKCHLTVKDLLGSNVEVVLVGKGKEVAKVKQALPIGEILNLLGNAPNETAWVAILKRVE